MVCWIVAHDAPGYFSFFFFSNCNYLHVWGSSPTPKTLYTLMIHMKRPMAANLCSSFNTSRNRLTRRPVAAAPALTKMKGLRRLCGPCLSRFVEGGRGYILLYICLPSDSKLVTVHTSSNTAAGGWQPVGIGGPPVCTETYSASCSYCIKKERKGKKRFSCASVVRWTSSFSGAFLDRMRPANNTAHHWHFAIEFNLGVWLRVSTGTPIAPRWSSSILRRLCDSKKLGKT